MRTLLGVPIWLDGAVRGALYVTDRGGGEPFLSGDQVTLATLARHAAHLVATRWY
jgi:GAF domain-containing protein